MSRRNVNLKSIQVNLLHHDSIIHNDYISPKRFKSNFTSLLAIMTMMWAILQISTIMAATGKEHLKLFLRWNKEVSGEDGFISSSSDIRNGICPTRIGKTNTDFFLSPPRDRFCIRFTLFWHLVGFVWHRLGVAWVFVECLRALIKLDQTLSLQINLNRNLILNLPK